MLSLIGILIADALKELMKLIYGLCDKTQVFGNASEDADVVGIEVAELFEAALKLLCLCLGLEVVVSED